MRKDAGPVPPLRQLKQQPPEVRAWAFDLGSDLAKLSHEEIADKIAERTGIRLPSPGSYSNFRNWQFRQTLWEQLQEMTEDDESRLTDKFPQLSREKIRDAVIKRSHAAAEILGDPKFQLAVVRVDSEEEATRIKAQRDQQALDQRSEMIKLDREKWNFDAAAAALAKLPELRAIDEDTSLSMDEKLDRARLALFGVVAE